MLTVYIPGDSSARALGADRIVDAVRREAKSRDIELDVVRNGTRGMTWLEPLVEIDDGNSRTGFGPMTVEDVPGLFDNRKEHPKAVGPVQDIPFFKNQTRLTFARVGLTDPLDLEAYEAHGGLKGLRQARAMDPVEIVKEVTDSGLRGRGGAGFPTGIKWETVRKTDADRKYIICNADEGDSGSFADRMLMEGDPFCLIEGMAISGIAVGATYGYIYLRSEYPDAQRILEAAITIARRAGILDESFDMEVRMGAGAYICGEETSMLNSLEGKRGMVRAKPPLPAIAGFMGRPTVANNVLSLAAIPLILDKGGAFYRDFGIGRSRGTIPLQLAGNIKYPGLYETAFGLSLGEIVNDIGGGTRSGRPVKAVQVGGPLGAYLVPEQFGIPFGYEDFSSNNALIGHAGLTLFDDTADMVQLARFAMEFCSVESCGKCTPCRIGSVRGVETIDRITEGDRDAIALLKDLCQTMEVGSLCALGGLTPMPVLSALTHFPEEFGVALEAAE